MRTFWNNLLCSLFGHNARGPIEGASFEIEPGHYHPFYQCRRCQKCLKWQIRGGWKAAV